jgi:hypothetical protein
LTTTGSGGDSELYAVLDELPVARDTIRGRATTCWSAQDPDTGEEYMVKDTWRPSDRTPEYELLELVQGFLALFKWSPTRTTAIEFMTFVVSTEEERITTANRNLVGRKHLFGTTAGILTEVLRERAPFNPSPSSRHAPSRKL